MSDAPQVAFMCSCCRHFFRRPAHITLAGKPVCSPYCFHAHPLWKDPPKTP